MSIGKTVLAMLMLVGSGYLYANESVGDLQEQIDSAYTHGKARIVIAPGVYRLVCPEKETWHLKLRKMKDFTIEASGVTLIFSSRDKRGILFEDCHNVTFRGATLLRETPPFSQGDLMRIASDRKAVDIKIHAGYPTDIDDPRFFYKTPVLTTFKPDRQLKENVPDFYIAEVERLNNDTFRFHLREPVSPEIPLVPGDQLAWRGSSPWKAAGHEVDVRYGSGIVFTDVTIKNSFGLAVFEGCGEGGNYYSYKYTYGPKPGGADKEPLLSGAGDGFHSAAMRKGPTLENCLFEGQHDDAVNIHGQFAMVIEAADRSVVADYRGTMATGSGRNPFARPGDMLAFYNNQGQLVQDACVTGIESLSGYNEPAGKQTIDSRVFKDRENANYIRIKLDRPVSAAYGWYVANHNEIGNGFVIRNCVFRNSRGHGCFIRAGNGVIENCLFEHIHMGGIVVAPEMGSWNEASYSRNLIIRNNTFRKVGIATQCWNSGLTIAGFENDKFISLPGGHRDIQVENNCFEDNDGINLLINAAIGVTVKGNRFLRPMRAPAYHGREAGNNHSALIWVYQARDVRFQDNRVIAPGECMKKVLDVVSCVNVTGEMTGIHME